MPCVMERVTMRFPKKQLEEIEELCEDGQYPNRSEAIRSAVREMLKEEAESGRRPHPWERS